MSKTTNRPRSSPGPTSDDSKAPTPNAWARPLKPRPPPGLTAPNKDASNANGSSNGTPPTSLSNPELRNRFLHLALSLVGHRVSLTQLDGTVIEGVFHTFTPFAKKDVDTRNKYVLKAVSVVKKGDQSNKITNGSTVIISAEKVVKLHCKSLKMSTGNGKADMFRTDTEISHAGSSEKDRNLVAAGSAWTSGAPSSNRSSTSRADALLEAGSNRKGVASQAGLGGNIGEWDQFQANKELFNVRADFDENLYTTELDKSTIDASKIQRAERLAREIEKTTSGNIHIAEERNQVTADDYDEEDRYSGVLNQKMQARSNNKDVRAAAQDQPQKPKIMNYAAAAAKADAGKAATVTGKKQDTNTTSAEESSNKKQSETTNKDIAAVSDNGDGKSKAQQSQEKQAEDSSKTDRKQSGKESKNDPGDAENDSPFDRKKDISKDEKDASEGNSKEKEITTTSAGTKTNETKEESGKKQASKLNANAKAFSFNPSAKTFTPGSFAAPAPPPGAAQDPHQPIVDPNTGMPILHPQMQGQPHYMHPSIGQPVMPMMNPHFAMRYAGGYPGMEQPVAPGPQPPQHMQQPQAQAAQQSEGSPSSADGDEQQQQANEESTQSSPLQQPQAQQPPHPGVPVPYPQSAAPYPYGNIPIPQRGPGGPHMAGYHPQMVGGPQQIPVVRSGNPYGHMYGMPQHPPQMRPNGSGYYPNAPPHYQHYAMNDEEYRGGGRAGRSGGRAGRRGGRKAGRGRGYWQNNNPREQNIQDGNQAPQNTIGTDEAAPSNSTQGHVPENLEPSPPLE